MIEHNTVCCNPTVQNSSPRLLAWTCHGINRAWVNRYLDPICHRHGDHLYRCDKPASFEEILSGDVNWDILFLGCDSTEMDFSGTLEAAITRLMTERPMDVVVAVAPSTSLERQAALLRAGAVEVIAHESDNDRLERALDRAISAAQARIHHLEQEKINVIGQLSVSVNHEINNHLAILMGKAELLLNESKHLSEKDRQDLETIIKMARMIHEVTVRLKNLKHLRTVPYGSHDEMLDLTGEIKMPEAPPVPEQVQEQFLPVMNLLVVDDNPLIIDLLARLFENRYTVEAAACASDALSKIQERNFDLVLVDVILPEMNGLELFRAIRRMQPQQKVMLTTAYRGDARVEQAIAEGALGCVFKPFKLEEIEGKLVQAIKDP